MIGFPEAPERESFIVPTKVSPLFNSILSPGIKPEEAELTFDKDFQGVDDDNPFAESLPVELT